MLLTKLLSALLGVVASVAASSEQCVTTLNSTCTGYRLTGSDTALISHIFLNAGVLNYEVLLGDSPVLQPSTLGLVRNDADLSGAFSTLECDGGSEVVQKYDLIQGKSRRVNSRHQEYKCSATKPDGTTLILQWAISGQSVAFRYLMPEDESITARSVIREVTTFAVKKSHGDYQLAQPYDGPVPKYQTFYQPRGSRQRVPIGGASSSTGSAFAALFRTSEHWILLKEAGFDGTYPASHIREIGNDGTVSLGFPSDEDADGAFGPGAPQSPLPWTTPWRIIVVGRTAREIVSDTSVTDLSEPSKIAETTWIRPGATSWSWWADATNPDNASSTWAYIDLASRLGWPYSLLDATWDQQTDASGKNVSLETTVAYAAAKNVTLWLWLNSAGPNNNATQNTPRDLLYERQIRRATMARLSAMGIVGLKVDGIQSDKQQMMAYLLDILRDAAEYKLMVVFHNCPLPHGWERTWPNLLSTEALISSEYYTNAKTAYAAQMPENNVNEAFVRFTIGPADYSPGVFSTGLHPVDETHTTWTHEVALNIIIDSGLRIFPDTPDAYEELIPRSVTDLLGSLPFAWDTTTFLQGEPGQYFIVAKRYGCDLYIAGINGETLDIDRNATVNHASGRSRNVQVDLSEFGIEAADVMTIQDIAGSREALVGHSSLNTSVLQATLEPFGGIVWRIRSR